MHMKEGNPSQRTCQNQLKFVSSKFVSHGARMLGELDSKKGSHSTKLEPGPQIIVKLSFRELCGSRLSGLYPFDNMTIIH